MISKICESEECTGCAACASVCPRQAITMCEDLWGCLHPRINPDLCVECNLCLHTCPNHRVYEYHKPATCFAAWTPDEAKRKQCASGGIATVMTESFLRRGGSVYGTRFDLNFHPVVTRVTLNQIDAFKGSKYVQSLISVDVYSSIRADLSAGEKVLFIGTPCQIAGLYGFLNANPDNLTTCDLVCHGVCPTSYWIEETAHLFKTESLQNITEARFRCNDPKYDFHLSFWQGESLRYAKSAYTQFYFCGFMKGITLRENCYHCRYAKPERIADITIGDFIGYDKSAMPAPRPNVSVFTINTRKGSRLFDECDLKNALLLIEKPYASAVCSSPSLKAPFKRHILQKFFHVLYPLLGYVAASRIVNFPIIFYTHFHHSLHILKTRCLSHGK